MLRSFKSTSHVRAKERTAALLALYTLNDGKPLMSAIDSFRKMEPPSVNNGNAFCTVKSVPRTFRNRHLPFRYAFHGFLTSLSEIWNQLRFKKPPAEEAYNYNVLQRLSYMAVIFFLFPLMIWTGMAMSPAITSVFPLFVRSSGGYETARTIHSFAANLRVLFVPVHVAVVCVAGFVKRTRAMFTGRVSVGRE
jgi:thiosulfate reductase cytochrome b subunit